jgi:hypothetical protein
MTVTTRTTKPAYSASATTTTMTNTVARRESTLERAALETAVLDYFWSGE